MEHLFYVLWHDCCKPWLRNRLIDIGYILLAAAAVTGVLMGMIFLEMWAERVVGGWL